MSRSWLFLCAAMVVGAAAISASASEKKASEKKLPEAVAKTFETTYPKAKVQSLDVSDENGVTIYDIEFEDGKVERETDIAADGTMLEKTLVVADTDIPEAAMRVIREHAKGAKIGRLEHIEIRYKTEAGKVIQLPTMETHYAAELTKGDKNGEIVVNQAGAVISPPEWVSAKAKPAEGKTEK